MSKGSAKIGYAAMLEQFGPTEVVDYSVAAEQAGFSGVMSHALILDTELKEQRARFDSKLKRILEILREN